MSDWLRDPESIYLLMPSIRCEVYRQVIAINLKVPSTVNADASSVCPQIQWIVTLNIGRTTHVVPFAFPFALPLACPLATPLAADFLVEPGLL